MKSLRFSLFFLALALQGYAQQAGLTADNSRLSSGGGTLKISASVTYNQTPGALGWVVTLPAGWSLVGTTGSQPPEIAPANGATARLEWAYVSIPDASVQFDFIVSYPAGLRQSQQISAEVITCSAGTTKSIPVNRVTFTAERNRPNVQER